MTTLNKRQSTAVENFVNSKLSTTDIEMMETATQPTKIGEVVTLRMVANEGGDNEVIIWDDVQNLNFETSNLSEMIYMVNLASKSAGELNLPVVLTVKLADGEEFYIQFRSGFFEAKASIFLKTVTATAGYLMQGAAGRLTKKALEKQIFKSANLINLLAFLAVAEGKTTPQMEQLGFLYAKKIKPIDFNSFTETQKLIAG